MTVCTYTLNKISLYIVSFNSCFKELEINDMFPGITNLSLKPVTFFKIEIIGIKVETATVFTIN